MICVAVPFAQAVQFSWQDNGGNVVSAAVPNRRCFLRSVWASIGLNASSSNIGPFWRLTASNRKDGKRSCFR